VAPGAAFCPHCGSRQAGHAAAEIPAPAKRLRGGSGSWKGLKRLLAFYGALMACSLALGLSLHLDDSPWFTVGFSAVWIALTLGFLAREWNAVKGAFRPRRPKAADLLLIAAASAGAVLVLQGYFALLGRLGWAMTKTGSDTLRAGWPLWSVFLLDSLEPGFIEEVAFRGILQTRLSQIVSRNEALVIQAALFSILHLSPAIFISHFIMGLLLGWVRQKSGHVYYGMLLHMGWNAYVIWEGLGHRVAA
jgi:membrane protease YdiL (CAAX protease family)